MDPTSPYSTGQPVMYDVTVGQALPPVASVGQALPSSTLVPEHLPDYEETVRDHIPLPDDIPTALRTDPGIHPQMPQRTCRNHDDRIFETLLVGTWDNVPQFRPGPRFGSSEWEENWIREHTGWFSEYCCLLSSNVYTYSGWLITI